MLLTPKTSTTRKAIRSVMANIGLLDGLISLKRYVRLGKVWVSSGSDFAGKPSCGTCEWYRRYFRIHQVSSYEPGYTLMGVMSCTSRPEGHMTCHMCYCLAQQGAGSRQNTSTCSIDQTDSLPEEICMCMLLRLCHVCLLMVLGMSRLCQAHLSAQGQAPGTLKMQES